MLIANHCGLRKVQRVKPARLQVKTFLSAGQTNAPANYSADYRRALIVMGDLPPVKRPTPRLLSLAGTPEHGSSEKCNHNIYDEELSSERSYLNAAQTRGKKYGRA